MSRPPFADGIYFDLPESDYHADAALGSSNICDLIVSPGTYWRGSALDPDRPTDDEDATKAQILGRAYHVARLEPERFAGLYVREPVKSDFPQDGFLSSDEKVKAQLKELGQQQTVSGESMLDRAERLRAAGYKGVIWTREKALFEATVAGRQPINGELFDDIIVDIERLQANAQVSALLIGGAAEVSVFWTDANGVRCKCRFDYLRPDGWADFKTFENSRRKILAQAIADAFRYNRYYIQAVHYRDGAEALRTGGLNIVGDATDDQRALIAKIMIKPSALDCDYIFQEKGGVPNLLVRRFEFFSIDIARQAEIEAIADPAKQEAARAALSRPTQICQLGRAEIAHAKRTHALYSQVYQPGEPWALIDPMGTIGDLDFNSYWLEGRGA